MTTSKRWLSLLAILAGCLLTSPPARAEWVYVHRAPSAWERTHFYMGAGPVGVAVVDQRGPRSFLENGGGFTLFLGGRVHRHVGVEFAWQPTFHNNEYDIFGRPIGTIGLEALTANVKLFPLHGRVQPYFAAGGGVYMLGDRFNVFAAGPGFQFGVGGDFWVSPWVSLGMTGQYRGLELYDYDLDRNNTYLSLLTIQADLTGHF